MTVTFHFNVGKKLALLTMPFEKGEDSHETMKKFFHEEDIPVYLEAPILGALENLFQEVIASSAEDLSASTLFVCNPFRVHPMHTFQFTTFACNDI